jgi:hypothetical protein
MYKPKNKVEIPIPAGALLLVIGVLWKSYSVAILWPSFLISLGVSLLLFGISGSQQGQTRDGLNAVAWILLLIAGVLALFGAIDAFA